MPNLTQEQLSDRLRAETEPKHRAIEDVNLLGDVFKPNYTREEYIRLLKELYSFYNAAETALAQGDLPILKTLEFEKRQKLPRLISDLDALGVSESDRAQLPLANTLPPLTTDSQALGYLYVAEGSTLGSQIIVKKLAERLGEEAISCTGFYHGYGPDTMPQWRAFQNTVNTYENLNDTDVIETAKATFDALQNWLNRA